MKAVRFHAARDVRVEQVPEPGAPGPGELLLAPRLCGICGTDLHEYMAGPIVTPSEPHPLTGAQSPQILGHELAAEVVAVGEGVTAAAPGDRVSVMPLAYCGRCYYCRRGLNHLCVTMGCVGLSWPWGGLGELALVADYQVAVLPDALSWEQGALVEPAAVALYGVDRGEVRPGDSVLITGAGPIGALAVLAARAAGAGAVYLSEPNPVRAERAAALEAADEILDPRAVDVAAELRARTGGIGVDVAIECGGNARALDDCVRATRKAGTVVQTGLHVGPAEVTPMTWSEHDLTIVGTWCYPVYDWPRIIALVASGRFPVERVVTSKIALEETVERGFEALVDPSGSELKILVEVGG
ncbi:MAG TPA: zinc-binding dehydrogenase [Conexibacter sp.]|jgi:(R,R)-butanediol dehydrogenase/meso-butanediol dehydrogenase/diacetyl reductase